MNKERLLASILLGIIATLLTFGSTIGRIIGEGIRKNVLWDTSLSLISEDSRRELNAATEKTLTALLREKRVYSEEVTAFVYSHYPFNFKEEIVISVGRDEGVEERDLVVLDDVFVGVISYPFVIFPVIRIEHFNFFPKVFAVILMH